MLSRCKGTIKNTPHCKPKWNKNRLRRNNFKTSCAINLQLKALWFEKVKDIWLFSHLLNKIFTLEQTKLFVSFSLTQIFHTFVPGYV